MTTIKTGTAGNDVLTANTVATANPEGKFDNSVSGLAGNDTLTGANGNDELIGGDGNDTLEGKGGYFDDLTGGAGSDTYVVNLGANLDFIDNFSFDGATTTDIIKLGAGITEADIFVTRVNNAFGGDLVIQVKGTNDVVWINNYFSSSPFFSGKIDQVVFNSGVSWNQATLESKIAYSTVGTALTDVLVGGSGADNIAGLDGIDFLNGGAGNDTLAGGHGLYDELQGNNGNDTYIFNLGDGRDGIINYAADNATTTDVLKFGVGIVRTGVTITQGVDVDTGLKSGDVRITINGSTTDKVDIYGYFEGAQIDTIVFGDGATLTQAQIDALIGRPIAEGTADDDFVEGYEAYGSDIYGYAGDDQINGYAAADKLDGGAGDDTLDGGAGIDTLIGGAGNDTYVIDNLSDIITETSTLAAEQDTVETSVSYTLGANLENLTLTGTANINGIGNSLANYITGNDGNNLLDGKAGADTMEGGYGSDIYIVDNINDVVYEDYNDSEWDEIRSSVSVSLDNLGNGNVERLILTGTAAINGTGCLYAENEIIGNSAANILDASYDYDFGDTLVGGAGNDTYIVYDEYDRVVETSTLATEIDTVYASISYTLGANLENLVLTDTYIDDANGMGNALANTITGNDYDNLLNGGAGADTLIGGLGSDTYILDNVGDVVIETASDSFSVDTVNVGFSYTLGANIEALVLTGAAAMNATGNNLDNVLTGNAAANTLNGAAGADTMNGGAGNDTYIVDNADDVIVELNSSAAEVDTVQASISYTLGANLEKLILTGSSALNGFGNAQANTLTGNSAANILDGGVGADKLIGGAGNDTYVVDSAGDVVTESSTLSTEIDTVQASISYTIGANVERLVLTGSALLRGTGNTLANTITGNSAANTLNGGAGADTLVGGAGNDTYIVDNIGDVVVETSALSTEIDTVQTSISYTLSANVEKLVLTGSSPINGVGNSLANTLTGNSGINILNGGAGADTLVGGAGNDTYVVDNIGDVVTESSTLTTEIDTVQAGVSFTLGAYLERLVLTGSSALNATGNGLANTLTGNGAANVLNGGAGVDTLVGGAGNDTYIIDNAGDVVTESSTLSTEVDTVQASVSFTLGLNLERLTLTGNSAINATGNGLANLLTGNGAANVLNGSSGADTLVGGAGNDTYIIDNVGDVVTESSTLAAEIDTVQSTISYTLGANLEKLVLAGSTAIGGTGNSSANTLTGNGSANTLNGGAGADTLIGGMGNDTYIMARGYGVDTIIEDDATVGNSDKLVFAAGIAKDQLWFRHVGNNLEVSIIGTADKMVVKDWYTGSANHVEQIKTTDGAKLLLDTRVENLVTAMSTLTPPPLGQTTLTTAQHAALDSVIAANWS